MNGKIVVTVFIFVAFAFFAFASLFMLYPPAANNWLTLAGFIAYVAVAVLVVRKVARK
jgi:membrane protein implicated in regulation of membrane protease activity